MPVVKVISYTFLILNTISDQDLITNNSWLNIMHTVMKYIYEPDIMPHIEKLSDAWYAVDQAGGYDFLEGTFKYLFTAANVKDYNKLLEVIQKNLGTCRNNFDNWHPAWG